MEIDNFQVHMEHMDFVGPNDRYLVHILRRKRDCGELYNTLGANESQRKIRTYCIESKEYLERKIPAIKELCQCCNARAYLVVQPKDNFQCLLNLGKKILDTIQLQNYSVKPERLLWTAYGEVHTSRKKLWVLDLDNDNMVERWVEVLLGGKALREREWKVEEVESFVKKWLASCGKDPSEMYRIPTRNGWHIITPPFNLQEAQKDCRMLFENQQEMPIRMERKFLGPEDEGYFGSPGLDVRYLIETEKKCGWLHKDALSLLYAPEEIEPKRVSPPDGTEIFVVFKNSEQMFVSRETTWCGMVPFDAGPWQIGIELYDNHTTKGDAGENYAAAVAWYYSKEEAEAHLRRVKGGGE